MRKLASLGAALVLAACGPGARPDADAPISGAQLAERIAADAAPLVLDVRTPEEYAAGHIPGALHIPYDELGSRLGELPIGKSDEVVVHCQSGRRAGLAETTLRDHGYTRVRDLSGHWAEWQAAGLPTE